MDIKSWKDTWKKINWEKDPEDKIIEKITEFYKAGVDFNMKPGPYDGLAMTPLMFAAQYSTPKVIDLLIDGGADITLTEENTEWTALHIAAREGKTKNVECLIKHAPKDFASKGDKEGWTSLHHAACKSNNTKTAKLLIENGVPVDIKNDRNGTPLHNVADAKMADFLIKHGADVNAKNDDNGTALHNAAYYLLEDVVDILLENGAKVNIPRKDDGWTALHCASYYCDSATKIIEKLVKAGEDINAKDDEGLTPLQLAVERSSEAKGVKALIDLGADVNIKDNDDRTALHHVVYNYDAEATVKALIDAGVDKDAVDCNGDTALLFAIKEEKTEIAKALVEAGVGLDIKDKRGYTALHRAIWSRDAKLVRALVERGANVNIKTPEGWFPSGMGETEMRTIVANADKIRADYLKKNPQTSLRQTLKSASRSNKGTPHPIGGRDPR